MCIYLTWGWFLREGRKKGILIKNFLCVIVEGDTCCLYKQPEGMKVEKWAIRTANVTSGVKNYLNKIHTEIMEGVDTEKNFNSLQYNFKFFKDSNLISLNLVLYIFKI